MVFQESEYSVSKRNEILSKKLNELASRAGYNIIQTNGQRIYAPQASKNITPPPRGCEVFIGKLSKYIYEDELIPLFESIGPLYKFRMMLDFTEKTRGYAFATYFKSEDADKAVVHLNGYEMRPKLSIGVYKSIDNCRLFIGNIPLDMTRDDVITELRQFAQGIVDVIMFHDPHNPQLNRGFVFVEFESHRFAAMARRQFTPNNLVIWDKTLYVDWADPLPTVDPNIMATVTILYLSNLPIDFNSDEIKACICREMSSQLIKKVHKNVTYAFVHFDTRSSAEFAFAKLQGFRIGNNRISVEWARPRQYSKKYRWVNPPENFCISVPPSIRKLVYTQKKSRMIQSSSSASYGSNEWDASSSKTKSSNFGRHYKNQNHESVYSSSRYSTLLTNEISSSDETYGSEYTFTNQSSYFNYKF